MEKLPNHYKNVLIVSLILIITFFTFKNILNHEFIHSWDDLLQVTDNADIRKLSIENLKKIFISSYVNMYQPITTITYGIDYMVNGIDSSVFHLSNLIIHLIAVILVYFLIIWLGLGYISAGFTALLYATGPLVVEPVAWISARSTLLSSVFFFAAFLYYLKYLANETRSAIILAQLFYLLALLSRVTVVVFPFIMLLAEIYLKKDWRSGKLMIAKLWFLFISIPVVWIGLSFRDFSGTYGSIWEIPLFMIPKTLWYLDYWLPVHSLSPVYSMPGWLDFRHLSALIFISGWILLYVKVPAVRKNILFGLFFFLICIGPYFIYSHYLNPVADRYGYLALFGVYLILGSLLSHVIKSKKPVPAIALFIILFSLNIIASSTYSTAWKDPVHLWYHATRTVPDISYAHQKLGIAYLKERNIELAMESLTNAIQTDSLNTLAIYNLGSANYQRKKYPEALALYDKAIRLSPGVSLFYSGRAKTHLFMRKYDIAIADLDQSIALAKTPDPELYYLRGICKIKAGESPCTDLNIALKLGLDAALAKIATHCL